MNRLCTKRIRMTFDEALQSLGKYDILYELYTGTVVIERRNDDKSVRKKDIVKLRQDKS